MKRFDELTAEQQAVAIQKCTTDFLQDICEGAIKFNDELNGDGLQARIDSAWAEAEKNQTPWFIGEFIMDTCREDIEDMARCTAEDSLYAERGENVIVGVA